jgi:hypothetical protein
VIKGQGWSACHRVPVPPDAAVSGSKDVDFSSPMIFLEWSDCILITSYYFYDSCTAGNLD